jgi:phosphoglycerate dehydrogenase-like enzyme
MAKLPLPPRRVLVGATLHADIIAWLRARRPELDYVGAPHTEVSDDDLSQADVYVGFKRPPRATSMGRVRWVHCTGAGVDSWLAAPGLDESILLTRTPESFGPPIAEWAIARIFAFQQQLLDVAAAQREARWAPRDIARVAGTRALIVGTGDIGSAIGTRLAALGVQLTGVARSARTDHPVFGTVHAVSSLADLVGNADWIILTVPDTPSSRALVSRQVLARCRGAVLLNAGRGAVVEEGALPEALDAGWLRGAALDVFAVEPLPATSPLWHDARVMISPHISGITTVEGAAGGFLECLELIERGIAPKWVVDRARGY